jgi:hypothetical protein
VLPPFQESALPYLPPGYGGSGKPLHPKKAIRDAPEPRNRDIHLISVISVFSVVKNPGTGRRLEISVIYDIIKMSPPE